MTTKNLRIGALAGASLLALCSTTARAGPTVTCVEGTSANGLECGNNSKVTNQYGTAIGTSTVANAQSTAVGDGAQAGGENAVAIGESTTSSSNYATAVGNRAKATNVAATAIGDFAEASGQGSSAVGNSTHANADHASAFGDNAEAKGGASFSGGYLSAADGDNSIALGAHSMERVTYGEMASVLPTSSDDYAAPMNAVRKFVFSTTSREAPWSRSTIASGDLAEEIGRLREQPGGEIVAWGAAQFAQSLTRAGLVDEHAIVTQPVACSGGKPLFRELSAALQLRSLSTTAYANGFVLSQYAPR